MLYVFALLIMEERQCSVLIESNQKCYTVCIDIACIGDQNTQTSVWKLLVL